MGLDRLVHAGQHDGVYYSTGYAGHGVQMATYMGRQMAEYMSGAPEANIWRDFGFRRIPGHFGPPWFLPVAVLTTSQDRRERDPCRRRPTHPAGRTSR